MREEVRQVAVWKEIDEWCVPLTELRSTSKVRQRRRRGRLLLENHGGWNRRP